MSDYAKKHWNYISNKDKGEFLEEDQLHTETIQDFKLVEKRIDEVIKGAKDEIAILFCNINTLKRKETQSILRFLKKRTRSDILETKSDVLVRILFPVGVDDRIINSYSEIGNVRIFERKLENNYILIVPDYIRVLLTSTTDPIDYNKETAYFVAYSDNEKIAYTYITTFEKLWLIQTVTKLEVTQASSLR
jgi:hypothetical protein